MKKIILLITVVIYASCNLYAQSADPTGNGFNHSSFTPEKKIITPELKALTDKQFYDHPEFGVLPYNAPCTDCTELLQKRDATHRYFVKNGSNGKEFYQQTSYGSLSYEENGLLRTVDPRIQPSEQTGVFRAARQPFPVTINVPEKFTSILNAGKELQVNRNVNIFIKHNDGSVASLGEPDWSNFTAGDDGVTIHNFYPGIDLELRPGVANIESFYRLNKPLSLGNGWLVIRDNMNVPQGLVYDYSHCERMENNYYEGTLFINGPQGTHYFYIGAPAAYDENNERDNTANLNYQVSENGVYDLYVPIAWMNDSKRSYPLIIDPFVSATSSLPSASITGSGYDATCFQNGCTYDLPVTVPAACTISNMHYSFNYRSSGCNLNQGAWDLTYSTCRSPSISGTWHTCTIGGPGVCTLQNLSCYADFQSCLPSPQCAAYTLPMVLTFYRCAGPAAGCGFSCVNADTSWNMTVTGYRTVVNSTNTNICQGTAVNLTATADSGVAPYSYIWYPGGLTGNPVSVSPNTTTSYSVTASTCGGLDSAQAFSTVTVFTNDNPGFTLDSDSVCINAPVTISGLGAGPAGSYDWILTGGTPAFVNNQQNFNVMYANAGNYNIIFNWSSPSNGCIFNDTQQITVNVCGVGIEESYLSNLFSVYPNPANTLLTLNSSFIHSNEAVTISIMNVLGEIMQEEKRKWTNETSINIKSLSSGMYFIQMKTENGNVVKRFVKE